MLSISPQLPLISRKNRLKLVASLVFFSLALGTLLYDRAEWPLRHSTFFSSSSTLSTSNTTITITTVYNSSWHCQGEGRNRLCEFTNFCIDQSRGPFIVNYAKTAGAEDVEPPLINMINTGEGEDIWFQPRQLNRPVKAYYLDETVFVYGLYSPYHFSHFLYNGLIPLYSTMQEKNASRTAWTMRAATFDPLPNTEIDLLLPTTGKDIVLHRADLTTASSTTSSSNTNRPKRQQLPPYNKPMCFSKAVVGTGNRCSLWYCDNQIPTEHYASYKSFILNEHSEVPDNQCAAAKVTYKSTGQYKIGILNRQKSRHITNIPDLIARLSAINTKQDGMDFQIELLDFDQPECDIVNTAHLVKDLDILIAPFGNGLGAGLFMKDDSALIAISARYWNEPWFKYPMTAIGRRIFNFECQSEVCKEYDETLAKKLLWNSHQIELNQTEMQEFLTTNNPEHVLGPYVPTKEQAWEPFLQFYKDTARRVDVDRFIPFLKEVVKNKPPKNMTFAESCKTPNVCCDLDCQIPLERNVFGEKSVWKNYL